MLQAATDWDIALQAKDQATANAAMKRWKTAFYGAAYTRNPAAYEKIKPIISALEVDPETKKDIIMLSEAGAKLTVPAAVGPDVPGGPPVVGTLISLAGMGITGVVTGQLPTPKDVMNVFAQGGLDLANTADKITKGAGAAGGAARGLTFGGPLIAGPSLWGAAGALPGQGGVTA